MSIVGSVHIRDVSEPSKIDRVTEPSRDFSDREFPRKVLMSFFYKNLYLLYVFLVCVFSKTPWIFKVLTVYTFFVLFWGKPNPEPSGDVSDP